MSWLHEHSQEFLKRIQLAKSLDIYPYFREFQNIGPRVWVSGRQYINFTSNDYLGLSQDQRLKNAARLGLERYGTGLGSSRVQATSERHVLLEKRLAEWFGYPACMVFTTGYQSLVGVLSTFAAKESTIILDNLSHASIIDGVRMAKGLIGQTLELRYFKHNSIKGVQRILKDCKYEKRMLVVEGVYSLDGDIAPLDEMYALAKEYNTPLIVDDAHGMGTLGACGRGVQEYFSLPNIDLLIGTFSKSFGGVGGFVLGDNDLIEFLKNSARSFTFSASLPVPQVEAMIASLDIISSDRSYTQRLKRNEVMMRDGLRTIGFDLGTSNTHIMPLVLRSDNKTLEFGAWLHALGVIMIPILYPAVPKGEERLRCNITAAHTTQDIGVTLEIVEYVGKKLGVLPSSVRNPHSKIRRLLWAGTEVIKRVQDLRFEDLQRLGKEIAYRTSAQIEELSTGHPAIARKEDIMKLKQSFFQKNVVITGGSSGIGRSLALQLARLGANLFLVARDQTKLDQVIAELETQRIAPEQQWEAIIADVGNQQAIAEAMSNLLAKRDIDILINNAGIAYANYIDQTPPDMFEQIMRTNYLGTVWTTQAMIPHFKQRRRGHIVNVSSLAGVVGFIGYAAYAPSKFAIMGFSEVLRNELIPHNVKVSVLLPPDTDTPQLAMENQTKPPETKALSGKAKLMQPDDVAMALLQGMVAERFHIVPGGFDSKVPYLGIRYIPGILRWVLDRDLMKVVNQKTEG